MKYLSPAKINLALDILRKDESGYHEIQTVLHEIPLYDEIIIEKCDGETTVTFIGEEAHLIDAQDNTAINALTLLQPKSSYKIMIHKNIPIGSGLGGASSNAATILKALNDLENLGLSLNELRDLANQISKDAVFFIEGQTALATHFGEEIQKLPHLDWGDNRLFLIVPQQRKSTKNMYAKVDLNISGKHKEDTVQLVEAMKKSGPIWKHMHNDFEHFTFDGFNYIKEKLKKHNANHVVLCGAGTAMFAVFSKQFDLKALSQALPHQRILDLHPSEVHAQSV